jgi:hypothetical protein
MNSLEDNLSLNMDQLGQLKRDLNGIDELLEERPLDPSNII